MRLAILTLLLLTACTDRIQHEPPDAPPDGVGSGSAAIAPLEPSPRDGNLELVVIGTSMIVAVAPVLGLRRRRRDDDALDDAYDNY